ncbi:MAG: YhfC family intramembrane metalloprotease [Candidatus Verstraetearchaeota archaeon]|nr:YhfC family intramembrane metalloprotease [Candidatus Verstraetearchaeota archaeon]
MLNFIFPIIGGLFGIIFLRLIGFKKFNIGDLLLGFVVFFISIIIQSFIQSLPFIIYISSLANPIEVQTKIMKYILSQELPMILLLSIWFGFIAAIIQSGFKYLFIRNKSYSISTNIGAGFGLTEAFYIGISGLISQFLITQQLNIPIYYYLISGLERFSVLLFHTGSTLYLFDSIKRRRGLIGFLVIVFIHGLIDFLAVIYQFTGSLIILILTEVIALLTGLLLTLKLYKKAIEEPKEKILW